MKYKVPTEAQKEILRRNGIDPDHVAVSMAKEDCIHLLNYNTRDEIVIRQGDKKW